VIRSGAALLLALGLVLSAGTAAAQGDEGEGRRRWKHGQELYDQGRYLDAAHEFEAGYAVAPRPLFFLSIGHAYRKAHELAKAKAAYEKLLTLQPDFPGRPEVEAYIRSINDALQVSEPTAPPKDTTAPAPPSPGLSPSPLPSTAAPPPPEPVPTSPYPTTGSLLPSSPPPTTIQTTAITEPAPESGPSVVHKPWFWVIVGAVVAGGVAAAVIAAHPSSSCPGTICIRETR
jgi:hypothetical protein